MQPKIKKQNNTTPRMMPMAEFAEMLVEEQLHRVKQLEREIKSLLR